MEYRELGRTGLKIAPIVFGGNVLGWTIDEKRGFEVLDAFFGQGFNAIDTADVYSSWAPGNRGGESETLIGRWLKARPGRRNHVVIFTKVGSGLDGQARSGGLSRAWITQAVEGSLQRLGVEAIDLYFSHWPDPATPHEETLRAYDTLLRAGKIKALGASNFNAAQLGEALRVAHEQQLPAYAVAEPEYNLYDRGAYEGALGQLCRAEGLGVVTYYSLASGFLSGKYRSAADFGKSVRGGGMGKYLNDRGRSVLAALDAVARHHGAQPAEVALAWLLARPGVTAPISSATSVAQVQSFVRATELELDAEDMAALE